MPILAAEPDRSPAHLFDLAPADAFGPGRAWWALHTKPRQEKSLARHLLAAGVAFYLPVVPRSVHVRGRVLTSHVPLFTSYLFLLADRAERVTALTSNRVVHALEVHDQLRLWRDLQQIDRLIGLGAPVDAEPRLAPGTPVEITTGPLAGLTGTVIRTVTGRKFVVRVDFIQQGASILLEDCALLPLRGGAAVP